MRSLGPMSAGYLPEKLDVWLMPFVVPVAVDWELPVAKPEMLTWPTPPRFDDDTLLPDDPVPLLVLDPLAETPPDDVAAVPAPKPFPKLGVEKLGAVKPAACTETTPIGAIMATKAIELISLRIAYSPLYAARPF